MSYSTLYLLIVTMINIEKYRFACSCFFSPKVLEINEQKNWQKSRLYLNTQWYLGEKTMKISLSNHFTYKRLLRFVLSCFFSPKVLEINALPPVPIINPNEPSAIRRAFSFQTTAYISWRGSGTSNEKLNKRESKLTTKKLTKNN